MNRFRLLTLTSLCVLASCNPPDTALRVSVTVRAQGTNKVRADCLKLSVLDGSTGAELKSLVIKRPTDDTALFGVRKGSDLPQAVKFQVAGLIGTCADETTLKVNALSEQVAATFPESGVSGIDVTLDVPNSSLDSDRDGFISAAKGGPDCKDDDSTIFPGAVQVCANTADTDCNGLGGCDDGACNTALVCIDPPDRVAVTANFASMKRYECLGPVHIELQNSAGPRIAVRDTMLTFASSLAGMSVHGTANCNDAALPGARIPYGSSSLDVYLAADDRAFGTEVLTVTASQVATPGAFTVDVHPQPVDHIEFTSMPLTTTRALTAGTCSTQPVTLEFKDAMNRHTDVDSATTVQLTSTPGDLGNIFFANAACSVDGATPMLQPGQGTITLYLLAKRAGTATMRAAPSTGTAAMQAFTVLPSTPTQLAFTNQALALLASDTCSLTTLKGELQDQFANAATLPADLAVRVSVTGLTGVTFSTSAGCSPALTDFTIPANSSLLTLYVAAFGLPSGMGTVQLAATNNAAITGMASQTLTVAAGPATRFTWNGSAQSPIAGQCSANPLTLTLTDTTGSVSPAMSTITFALAAVPASADATFRFFSNAGCVSDLNNQVTFTTGQSSATVYFRGNKAVPSFEIVGTGTSLVGPANRAQGNAIRPAAPAKLVFTAPLAQTAQAGVCTASPYQANVLDQYDNATSFAGAQTVSVASSPPGVTVGQGACDVATSVPLAAGATSATFSARHTVTSAAATPYTLTASVAGFSTAPGVTLAVTPGPSSLSLDTPVGTPTVTAGLCQNITISRRDGFMNAAPVSGNQAVTLNFPPSTTWVVYPTPGCSATAGTPTMLNNTNTVSFSVSPRTAGAHMFNASIGAGATLQSVPINITVTPANASLRFETPATGGTTANASQTAGGCTPITLGRRDMYGNDVTLPSAQSMTFMLPPGTTVHSGTPCTLSNAISSIPLTTSDVRTTFYVSATQSSPTGGTAMQTITATLDSMTATLTLAVAPGASILGFVAPTGGAAPVVADACLVVTLERRDALGNPVSTGASPTVAFTPISGAVFTAYDSANCMGTATVVSVPVTPAAFSKTFSIKSVKAGTQAVDLTLEGQTVRLTMTVTPGTLAKLIVENVPATFTAGGCSGLITVRRQDANNNDITADGPLSVALSSSRFSFSNTPTTCAGATTGATVNIAMGSAVSADAVYATGTQSGATTVVATSTTPAATGSAPCTIGASTATQLVFLTAAGTVVANACSANIQIEQRDTYGNQVTPSAPYAVTLGSSGSVFSSAASCAGTLPLNLQAGNVVGNFTFKRTSAGASETITVSGTGPVLSAMQTWTVTPAAASKLAWKQNPVAAPARFACASAGILQTQDTVGNVSNVSSALTVTPSSTNAGLTFFSDAACTTPLTTLSIASGNSETAEFYYFATGSASVNLAATAPLFTAAPTRAVTPTNNAGSLVVTPANPAVEAGACVALTIERRTDANTPFSTGTSVLSAAVANGASVTLYSSSDCSTTPLPATFSITQSASTALVYARGRSVTAGATPVDNVFTATDTLGGSTPGTTTLKVYPLVRRGSCDLVGMNSLHCALTPPIPGDVITRSFVVFSSKGRPATSGPPALAPADQNVECHLETSVGPGAEVVCTRVGSNGTMNVNYQVVSFGRDANNGGVTVQHFPKIASTATTTTQTITSVSTANTFLLASSTLSGATNDGDGFPLAHFATTGAAVTSVEILGNTNTNTTRDVSVQVVTMAGAVVDHRNAATPAQTTGGFTVATNTTGNAFALTMAQITNANDYTCKRRLNTKVNASSVGLHRGNGNSTNCTADAVALIAVQRVSLTGAATVQLVADVAVNNTSPSTTSAAFTAVATHKAITFLMSQGPGGQTSGESNQALNSGDNDDTGTFHAIVDFASTTTVSVTRDAPAANANSLFSPVVVQFDP